MAADAWLVHDKIKEYIGNKVVDFDADNFRLNLFLVGSNIATLSTDAKSTWDNEHATANGYPANGNVLSTPTWTESSGTITFDAVDNVFTASSGSIVARFAGIQDDSVASPVADPVVCHSLLDNGPADVTATDGNTLTIEMNASGIFTLA